MCITGLVFLLLTVTASMVSYPVHLVSMAFSFTTLPPDVPARVLLLLGATVGPVLCATASSIASSTDVAAVLGQLRAAVHVLRFPMDIPGRAGPSHDSTVPVARPLPTQSVSHFAPWKTAACSGQASTNWRRRVSVSWDVAALISQSRCNTVR